MKDSITSIYRYDSMFSVDSEDILNRFEIVKVEATSFTVSEPFEDIEISAVIYDKADDSDKAILSASYEVAPFNVKTITMARIYVDKIFATEFYFRKKKMFDVAKHVYDLSILCNTYEIRQLYQNKQQLESLVAIKRKEEENRIGSELSDVRIGSFGYLKDLLIDKTFLGEFNKMQSIYVFDELDKITLIDVDECIKQIKQIES